MRTQAVRVTIVAAAVLSMSIGACGTSGDKVAGAGGSGGSGGSAGSAGVTAGMSGSTGGSVAGSGGVGAGSGGTTETGGSAGAAGASSGSAGTGASGSSSGGSGAGASGSAGAGASESSGGASGSVASGGSAGAAGASGGSCTVGGWPAADPAAAGPFATVTETNVGPQAGQGADGGAPVAFTMFRPMELGDGGRCHPVVTWGNGTGSNPSLYKVLLNHLASHGFVVIASDSPNVAQGDPPPMVAGVTWVLEQNDDPASPLYQHIDTMHVGATGHSQGGFATTTAGGDSHVLSIAPLCGASNQRNLHGPAFLFCGGMDTTVPCSTVMSAFNGISNQPVMLATYLTADHANWITFRGTTPGPVEVAVTAWMRVHLMGDTALRSWFYGPACTLCTDPDWQIQQKMMDQ